MIEANALLDSNIANHIKAQQDQLRNRQKEYFRKALPAKYSRPAILQQSRQFQASVQSSCGNLELSSPLKSVETEIRIWIGLPERGVTQERRQQFKRNMAIGILATLFLLGILRSPVSQTPLNNSTLQCQEGRSRSELPAKRPAQTTSEKSVVDLDRADSFISKDPDQDPDLEPFDDSKAVMQEW